MTNKCYFLNFTDLVVLKKEFSYNDEKNMEIL
jgi:hypothetical protein